MQRGLRTLITFLVLVAVFLPVGSSACGCGVALQIDPASSSWQYASGNTTAFINYRQNTEELVFARTIQAVRTSNKILLIPVPAMAQDVRVDVQQNLPNFNGPTIEYQTGRFFGNLNQAALVTQIVPSIIWHAIFQRLNLATSRTTTLGAASKDFSAPAGANVTVYQHLEKNGLVNEVLTAKSATALNQYFLAKKLTIDVQTIPVLEHYLGQNYILLPLGQRPKQTQLPYRPTTRRLLV